ncbi:MAG: DUF3179 domain-containing protein [Halobacteriaceae archaeon]
MDIRQVIPRDAIPSIDEPEFGSEYQGSPGESVLVLEANPARAYPVSILNYHEVVNDVVDGEPTAVTWCPLCGSAVVYDRRVEGRTLTFGVSGKLADDDLVLYDRETNSEWKQSSGKCLSGPLAGRELTVKPATMITEGDFRAQYPEGLLLQPPGTESEAAGDGPEPERPNYDQDPYREYERAEGFGIEVHRGVGEGRDWTRDDLDPKAVVLGLELAEAAKGYPLGWVRDVGGVVQDTLGDRAVLVVAGASGIHAYEDPGYDWSIVAGQLEADGTTWGTHTGASEDGRTLSRLPARRLFAFAWQDDHGPEAFWRPTE